ncbi:RNA polymerase sigma factor [Nocardia sp. NPDC051750]|uniref:RNA polymerase sigma factor n=1 Tax=Nocardia sp. NPDC051750 TaxID=3364325 RepID=UPI0037B2E3BC
MTGQPSSGEEEFDELFRRHAPAVFRFALKSFHGDRHQADEVVQQVFLAVWRQFDRDFAGRSADRAVRLIMRIAHHRVIDVWRRQHTGMGLGTFLDDSFQLDERAATYEPGPAEQVLSADALKRFWYALSLALTATEYQVAVMAWEIGLRNADIAGILGCMVGTVFSHKSRARKKIQQVVDDEDLRMYFSPRMLPPVDCSRAGRTGRGQ